jgi:hypothetical protein
MTIGLFLVLSLVMVTLVYGLVRLSTWRNTPVELRGDWWARFERQFRAYATAAQLDRQDVRPERRRPPR